MTHRAAYASVGTAIVCLFTLTGVTSAQAPAQAGDPAGWDVTLARGKTREIDFKTSEGTWMSVDLSPDGKWIAFDLLAHIYRVSATGGEAECLTQNSGVALNTHPRISPDGKEIAFVSDRQGQDNLWIMNADGSNPRPLFISAGMRVMEPAWTPDGKFILVRRTPMGGGEDGGGGGGGAGIWMYPREGGAGTELVGATPAGASWPSVSPDGKYVYYHATTGTGRDVVRGAIQLRRIEIATKQITQITYGEANQQIRQSSGGGYAAEISPDGRSLAFARRTPNGRIVYKGHEFGPRTALWLRDVETGSERLLMDPIEVDLMEGRARRQLPGYSWARDGKSIVISQGGKIRRLDVASGKVTTIPFTARVHRTISEMASKSIPITDAPFEAKALRWHTASPDGKRLAFQSIGRVWVMDVPNGTPRPLTTGESGAFEYAPTWSPDGKWMAFTTFDDTIRGHVWKAPTTGCAAAGCAAVRLTKRAGEFTHPLWSPDGQTVFAMRGSGATARGQGMMFNPWYDLVRLPSNGCAGGCAEELVTRVTRPAEADVYGVARRSIVQPAFGPGGRIYYLEEQQNGGGGGRAGGGGRGGGSVTALRSITPDGGDKKTHMTFQYADEAAPSPDGKWAAFQEGDEVYLTSFPSSETDAPVAIDKKRGKASVKQLSAAGGVFLRWRDATSLEYGSGNRHYVYHTDTQRLDSTVVHLSIPRPIPAGTIALTNARIVTLNKRAVVENGTVVIKGSRIACVGQCATTGVDRIIDARGKTIIPGFVDMHAHQHREFRGMAPRHDSETGAYLAFGVTTDLDPSVWSQNVFPLADLINAGEILGPRTYSTGDPMTRGDGTRANELTSRAVTAQNVDRLQSWGAVSLKQYMQPRRDQRQWVSDVARERGINVTGEGGDLEYDLSMVMDGQTGWEHPLDNMPLYSDVTRFIGLAKATYSVTFDVGGPSAWNEEYWWAESEVWRDPKMQRWLPWRTLLPQSRRVMLRPKSDYSYPMLAQAVADIIAAGGNGAIGAHGQAHGLAPHWEVWMAASALGNMGALELSSLRGARFLGAEKDIGSIEVGKLADLMVLNSNPLENIRNTRDIKYVMQGGRLFESETLDEVWPKQVKYAVYPWINEAALRSDARGTDYFDKPNGRGGSTPKKR